MFKLVPEKLKQCVIGVKKFVYEFLDDSFLLYMLFR